MQPLAKRTQEIKRKKKKKQATTEDRMDQRHHGEHAVAEWRTEKSKEENGKKKKLGGRKVLFLFCGTIREGRGFVVTPCRRGGRGGRVGGKR